MKVTITARVDDKLWKKIQKLCFKKGITFSSFVNDSIKKNFEKSILKPEK